MEKPKRQSGAKIAHLESKLQAVRSENRRLRQRLLDLARSRSHQRSKVKVLRKEIKGIKRASGSRSVAACLNGKTILGHGYDSKMVGLCVALYAFAGCSYRCVKRVLLCLQLELGIMGGCLPSKSSVGNWVEKLGHYHYEVKAAKPCGQYCILLDESMVFGQERMMVALLAPAQKGGGEALGLADVRVLGFSVRTSWKWGEVRDFLLKVQEKTGTKADYVVCDGGVNLKKGVEEAGLLRICDVGHEICKFTEQSYKGDKRYLEWVKAVSQVRYQVFMTRTAYLLPPKQRTVARFTNLAHVVDWAVAMLMAMPALSAAEQKTYGWLKAHEGFIGEFSAVFQTNNSILKILKNEGLSDQNIEKCIQICQNAPPCVPQGHLDKIRGYLRGEKAKIKGEGTTWHMSSDVLESLFGKYKHRAPANPLNGVTARALTLCLMTGGNCDPGKMEEQIIEALLSVSMANLKEWKNQYIIENQLVKRRKILKK